MKTRDGFVPNSSSSMFLLDLANEKAKKYFEMIEGEIRERRGSDLSRATGYHKGVDVLAFIESIREFGPKTAESLSRMVSDIAVENAVLIIASDEGMGGELPADPPRDIILAEYDYH